MKKDVALENSILKMVKSFVNEATSKRFVDDASRPKVSQNNTL